MESPPRSIKERSEFQGPLLTNNARRRSLESCVSPFDPKATGRKSKISRVGHERQRRLGDPFGGTFAGPVRISSMTNGRMEECFGDKLHLQ